MLKFRRNMNNFDRITRFIVAMLLLSLFFFGHVRGIFGAILLVVAFMFAFASITSFCPFYKSTNLSTYKKSEEYLDEL